jgi:hypothetical protein
MELVWVLVQMLGALTWGPHHAKAELLVFQTQEEMSKVWLADGGKKEEVPQRYDEIGELRIDDKAAPKKKDVPVIDFEKNTVVALFMGEMSNGIYTIKIEKIITGDMVFVLYKRTAEASSDAKVAKDIKTYPSHVVVIPKTTCEFKLVTEASDEGKELEALLKNSKK